MWAPSGPPRQTYLCLSGKEALRKVLELGILKQLSGDRLEQLRAIEYRGKVPVTRGPGTETNCVGGDCEHGPRKSPSDRTEPDVHSAPTQKSVYRDTAHVAR